MSILESMERAWADAESAKALDLGCDPGEATEWQYVLAACKGDMDAAHRMWAKRPTASDLAVAIKVVR